MTLCILLAAAAAVAEPAATAGAPGDSPAEAAAVQTSAAHQGVKTDVEAWNEGVDFFRAGDATNALRTLRPLMLSKKHGARAAELVAKLEYDRGNLEEAAAAAQIALRAAPDDERAGRNFTRAVDGLPEMLASRRVNAVLKAAEGRDPGAMILASTHEARALMAAVPACFTNSAHVAVATADALSARAFRLTDSWLPVKQAICQSVTNEEQAATIVQQLDEAEARTKSAARQIADMEEGAYSALADSERDFTRFLKMTVLPPAAMGEDLVAQSNAWLDVEDFNGRSWQNDALDFTRAFRAKFPAWARAYEQQAQADTNKPPFTAEDQAKVSALATELEKLQLECVDGDLPPSQERALDLIRQIQELLPKDGGGGQGDDDRQKGENRENGQQQQQNPKSDGREEGQPQHDEQNDDGSGDRQEDGEDAKEDESGQDDTDKEVDAILRKAQERSDEHEAEKKARMRKAPLPPNERDW